jgi:hypothetical protein
MTRTPGDTARRRNIADAAAGFPNRATVVLYARIAPCDDQQEVIARLRRHAEARDWVVVGEVINYTQTDAPYAQVGHGWQAAKRLVTSGQAKGIVTTSRQACADVAGLDEWLLDQQAFLFETATAPAATEGAVS